VEKQVEYNIEKLNELEDTHYKKESEATHELFAQVVDSIINLSDAIGQFKSFRKTDTVEPHTLQRFMKEFVENKPNV